MLNLTQVWHDSNTNSQKPLTLRMAKKKKKGEGANPQEKKPLKLNNKTKGIRGTERQVQRGGQRYNRRGRQRW